MYVPEHMQTCMHMSVHTQTNGVSEENIQILRVYTIHMAWLITVTY